MAETPHNPWVHRWAVIAVLVSLLPVTMGALTTTLDAGMAFNDWPTSDGHNMLTYPWFRSYGDKFIEHGHRLGGMLIGFVTLILVGVVFRLEKRRWVQFATIAILLSVIGQGLLGGGRVRMNARTLAMIHGQSAAWVVSLLALLACWTSKSWRKPALGSTADRVHGITPFVCILPVAILIQYTLGGFLRHKHTAMQEHLVFAFVVMFFAIVAAVLLIRSGVPWLRNSGKQIAGLVLLQVALGAGAWATRFGFATMGYVARARSPEQTWLRTSHTIVGMMLLAAAVVAVARTLRVASIAPTPKRFATTVARTGVVPQSKTLTGSAS
ncbi:MAG: heme A synthase [Planctomycetaceae bacterium]